MLGGGICRLEWAGLDAPLTLGGCSAAGPTGGLCQTLRNYELGPCVAWGLLCLTFHVCKWKGFSRKLVSFQGSWLSESSLRESQMFS